MSEIAQRLKDYNFDVLEKDLSGMYAMQAQMQGQGAPPEPTDEQIKDLLDPPIDWWTCRGCGTSIDASQPDLVVDHVRDCDLVDGAGNPVPARS